MFEPTLPVVDKQNVTVEDLDPPSTVPFKVAPVVPTELAASVVAVGAVTKVVKFKTSP